ncbi:LytR family transcriptional regulator [Fredinandcohnia quinoae]|uniref:Polyisoprenyl-teichoic acid--peptidoglycan teichoic acid transferase TagU n=1 Tax=Fredinandcohnia quinoae TaxID=2918902 RepID=A0AAW5E5S0_9BACI|nr:LytR family transcriptional regulator [Fredinandcohnia sp. SECRCQ15]MCH1627848.1 LytR family transcriptional regulator [Fredinandcohnia sp. SECRCQ15]
MGRTERNAKKKKKWPKIVGIISLILVLAVGGYAIYLYQSVASTVGKMHEERGPSDKRVEEVNISESDPLSILLVGVDERKGDKGRTDSIVVVSVNPKQKSMQMLSIPRDTRVEIVGKGTEDKINHAYAFGGIDMTIDTIEHFLDVPIDYFVKVNMEGFQQIIDSLGGIEVQNTFAFSYGGNDFPEGHLSLKGSEALNYSRMRYEDPKGDFGRQDRQKQVIKGIVDKGASFSSITKFDDILEALEGNVTTNMSFDEMKSIQANYKEARHNVDQFTIKGTGKTLDKWYYIVSEEERLAVSERLKKHLEIK